MTDVRALRDSSETRERLTSRLDIELATIEIGDVNELNAFITTTVRECVNEVCPKLEVVKKR